MSDNDPLQLALRALEAVSSLDPSELPRTIDLGISMDFSQAVEPFEKIQALFSKIRPDIIKELPPQYLNTIIDLSSTLVGIFNRIKDFSPHSSNPGDTRASIIQELTNSYDSFFQRLMPLISFSTAKSQAENSFSSKTNEIDKEIREKRNALLKNIELENEKLKHILGESQQMLQNQRTLSGEAGVTKMVDYFEHEAVKHNAQAENWRNATFLAALILILFSVASFFSHRLVDASKIHEFAQLAVSKALIFFTIAYGLILSARNFLAHKHNAIVNRHRHNALLTFKTISDAASMPEGKDTVLSYAAACIFAQQETGYIKPGSQPELPTSVIKSAMSKITSSS